MRSGGRRGSWTAGAGVRRVRRAGVDEIAWVIEAFRTRYFDFTAKHFHEAIQGRPMADGTPFSRGYTWTKSVLQDRDLAHVGCAGAVLPAHGQALDHARDQQQ